MLRRSEAEMALVNLREGMTVLELELETKLVLRYE